MKPFARGDPVEAREMDSSWSRGVVTGVGVYSGITLIEMTTREGWVLRRIDFDVRHMSVLDLIAEELE